MRGRANRNVTPMPEIARVFEENVRVYGVSKVWRQLKRAGHGLAQDTVARLIRGMGRQGVIRSKPVRTSSYSRRARSRTLTIGVVIYSKMVLRRARMFASTTIPGRISNAAPSASRIFVRVRISIAKARS